MPKGLRKPGEFCWINILTPKPEKACAFFGELLGWTFTEMPGMGHFIKVAGHDIGGLYDLNGPQTPPGLRPVVGVMVKVESADAAAEKVKSLGGDTKPPFDVLDKGRMAVCFDPNGAEFDVWESKVASGTEVDSALHGAPSWSENLTTDTARATAFYADLFGWTPEVMPMPGFDYTAFKLGSEFVAGMMPILPHMGNVPPHWGTYFTVSDTDETAGLATRLGGTVCVPPTDIPNVGRFCGVNSPQGVMFYVIKYAT
jgi:uncharacterized protein